LAEQRRYGDAFRHLRELNTALQTLANVSRLGLVGEKGGFGCAARGGELKWGALAFVRTGPQGDLGSRLGVRPAVLARKSADMYRSCVGTRLFSG
jgi:hypothetical protein